MSEDILDRYAAVCERNRELFAAVEDLRKERDHWRTVADTRLVIIEAADVHVGKLKEALGRACEIAEDLRTAVDRANAWDHAAHLELINCKQTIAQLRALAVTE